MQFQKLLGLDVLHFGFHFIIGFLRLVIRKGYLFGAVLFLRNVHCEGAFGSVKQEDLVEDLIIDSYNGFVLFFEGGFM